MRCLAENYLAKDCRLRKYLVKNCRAPCNIATTAGLADLQKSFTPAGGTLFCRYILAPWVGCFWPHFGRNDFAGTIRGRSCGADSCRPFICHLTCHHRQSWQYFGLGGKLVSWPRFNRTCRQMVVSGKCQSIGTGNRLV